MERDEKIKEINRKLTGEEKKLGKKLSEKERDEIVAKTETLDKERLVLVKDRAIDFLRSEEIKGLVFETTIDSGVRFRSQIEIGIFTYLPSRMWGYVDPDFEFEGVFVRLTYSRIFIVSDDMDRMKAFIDAHQIRFGDRTLDIYEEHKDKYLMLRELTGLEDDNYERP